MAESIYKGIEFDNSHVVEPDECIYQGEYNPHNVRPWLIHDHGTAICVVFAGSMQDALDGAVDENKLDKYQLTDEQVEQMDEDEDDSYACLGNASEPFDISRIEIVELPIPKRSFCAQFNETPQ